MAHKGIILAGGNGSRLYPATKVVSKQLLPVYKFPMINYPLSTLIESGIKEIFIISTIKDTPLYMELLGDGKQWGVNIKYGVQTAPNGLAEAFIIGRNFIGDDNVTLILGDNIFWGDDFIDGLKRSIKFAEDSEDACIFGYKVKDPQRYGVMCFDHNNTLNGIEEKPKRPKSHYAIIGAYTYPNNVIEMVNGVTPSERGELEITSLNNLYLQNDELDYILIDNKNNCWIDTGTHESLLQASNFVKMIEDRNGIKFGCLDSLSKN